MRSSALASASGTTTTLIGTEILLADTWKANPRHGSARRRPTADYEEWLKLLHPDDHAISSSGPLRSRSPGIPDYARLRIPGAPQGRAAGSGSNAAAPALNGTKTAPLTRIVGTDTDITARKRSRRKCSTHLSRQARSSLSKSRGIGVFEADFSTPATVEWDDRLLADVRA